MEFRITVVDGDLGAAHRALSGVGALKIGPATTGYADGDVVESNRLRVLLDADDADDAEGLVMAVLPRGCTIDSIEAT